MLPKLQKKSQPNVKTPTHQNFQLSTSDNTQPLYSHSIQLRILLWSKALEFFGLPPKLAAGFSPAESKSQKSQCTDEDPTLDAYKHAMLSKERLHLQQSKCQPCWLLPRRPPSLSCLPWLPLLEHQQKAIRHHQLRSGSPMIPLQPASSQLKSRRLTPRITESAWISR